MKKLVYLLIFSALIVSFTSCKDDNKIDAAWRDANLAYYDSIATAPDYKALKRDTEGAPTGVYYHIIKSGERTEHSEYPFQTSKVKVRYSGTYYDGTVFFAGTSNGIATELFVNSQTIPRGLSFALQNMIVGDVWDICIPYYLGYGASGYTVSDYYSYSYQTIIKGYSTLNYKVELVSITLYPN